MAVLLALDDNNLQARLSGHEAKLKDIAQIVKR